MVPNINHTQNLHLMAGYCILSSPIFANWEHWLSSSIWVLIISQFNIYVHYAVLNASSPPSLQCPFRSIFVDSSYKNNYIWACFPVTRQILITSQNGELEGKEHPKQQNLHIYGIVIRAELTDLFGPKVLSLQKCGTTPKTVVSVQFGYLR